MFNINIEVVRNKKHKLNEIHGNSEVLKDRFVISFLNICLRWNKTQTKHFLMVANCFQA